MSDTKTTFLKIKNTDDKELSEIVYSDWGNGSLPPSWYKHLVVSQAKQLLLTDIASIHYLKLNKISEQERIQRLKLKGKEIHEDYLRRDISNQSLKNYYAKLHKTLRILANYFNLESEIPELFYTKPTYNSEKDLVICRVVDTPIHIKNQTMVSTEESLEKQLSQLKALTEEQISTLLDEIYKNMVSAVNKYRTENKTTSWQDLCIGILISTGARPVEILNRSSLESAQSIDINILKRDFNWLKNIDDLSNWVKINDLAKSKQEDHSRICPSLYPVEDVLEAFQILREVHPYQLDNNTAFEAELVKSDVANLNRYIKEKYQDYLQDIVVYTLRSLYVVTALERFCPPTIHQIKFAGDILGHKCHKSTLHYMKFYIEKKSGQKLEESQNKESTKKLEKGENKETVDQTKFREILKEIKEIESYLKVVIDNTNEIKNYLIQGKESEIVSLKGSKEKVFEEENKVSLRTRDIEKSVSRKLLLELKSDNLTDQIIQGIVEYNEISHPEERIFISNTVVKEISRCFHSSSSNRINQRLKDLSKFLDEYHEKMAIGVMQNRSLGEGRLNDVISKIVLRVNQKVQRSQNLNR